MPHCKTCTSVMPKGAHFCPVCGTAAPSQPKASPQSAKKPMTLKKDEDDDRVENETFSVSHNQSVEMTITINEKSDKLTEFIVYFSLGDRSFKPCRGTLELTVKWKDTGIFSSKDRTEVHRFTVNPKKHIKPKESSLAKHNYVSYFAFETLFRVGTVEFGRSRVWRTDWSEILRNCQDYLQEAINHSAWEVEEQQREAKKRREEFQREAMNRKEFLKREAKERKEELKREAKKQEEDEKEMRRRNEQKIKDIGNFAFRVVKALLIRARESSPPINFSFDPRQLTQSLAVSIYGHQLSTQIFPGTSDNPALVLEQEDFYNSTIPLLLPYLDEPLDRIAAMMDHASTLFFSRRALRNQQQEAIKQQQQIQQQVQIEQAAERKRQADKEATERVERQNREDWAAHTARQDAINARNDQIAAAEQAAFNQSAMAFNPIASFYQAEFAQWGQNAANHGGFL